ncbi:MAG: nucleotide exchange factor GrpE [Ruminococcaceae bacterium]|nr:nucleotide exchange factor GrpE [Oscillospiraceae bacterium]
MAEEIKKETEETPCEDVKEETKKDKKCKKEIAQLEEKVKALEAELEKANADLAEQNDKYLRMLAEYENFRRRSQSEKEAIYGDSMADTVSAILPVIDNLEMALAYKTDSESVVKGVGMTLTQFSQCLEGLGIEVIKCETFDPNYHNAVMHVEDDSYAEGQIVEVLRKGYKKGEKVIRYAMVKVAN